MRLLKNVVRENFVSNFATSQTTAEQTLNSVFQSYHLQHQPISIMNRVLLGSSLFFLLLVWGNSTTALAQSPEERDRARAEQMLTSIESKLVLEPAQKEKIKEILVRNQSEFRAERETAKGDKLLLFRLANERMKKIDDEISATLRPDQKSGYEAAKDELRQSMRERNP